MNLTSLPRLVSARKPRKRIELLYTRLEGESLRPADGASSRERVELFHFIRLGGESLRPAAGRIAPAGIEPAALPL